MLCQEASQQGDQATQGQNLGFSNQEVAAFIFPKAPKSPVRNRWSAIKKRPVAQWGPKKVGCVFFWRKGNKAIDKMRPIYVGVPFFSKMVNKVEWRQSTYTTPSSVPTYPLEIAGASVSRMKTHYFPLIRPAIKPLFLRGYVRGGVGWLAIQFAPDPWNPSDHTDMSVTWKNGFSFYHMTKRSKSLWHFT